MTNPKLPSLRVLTAELRELHTAWSHPDAGGEYVRLVCEVGGGWRVCAVSSDMWVAYADTSREDSLMTYGCEYVHGAKFDAVAAARRLLAAARDGGAK